MMINPLVSIVTPVYNGEEYLHECITSVLNQTHQNWEYIIVDNCSTDSTPEILRQYAQKESRIRLIHNAEVLPIMQNWNHMLLHVSEKSSYCKVVHADDWLFPECLTKMVEVGEKNPSTGIIGAYSQWGHRIGCTGLPYNSTVMSGHDICKLTLLKRVYPFLSPSSLMIRSDQIRQRKPFYKEPHLHADVEACYEVLQHCDFGFVHEILTFVRRHEHSATSIIAKPLNKLILQNLDLLVRFGPKYLAEDEFHSQLKLALTRYYRFLARSIIDKRDDAFWDYHRQGLKDIGLPLNSVKLRMVWILEKIRRLISTTEGKIIDTII